MFQALHWEENRGNMRRYRIWYGAAVLAALLIYIISNRSEALAAFLCLVIVPVVSLGIELAGLRGFELKYSIKPSCHVGQKIPLEICIRKKNKGPLGRIQLELEMENTKPGSAQQEVLVYPAELQLNTQLLRRPETIISGELYDQNRKGQDVSEVSGLRDYAEGDSLGSIHWKLSSKLDNLVVREFGYPSNYNILILYDLKSSSGEDEISNQRNDAVLAFTSALSRSMVERNLEYNVGCASGGEMQNFPVYSLATCDQMVLNILCRPVPKENGEDSMYRFLQEDIRQKYTKLIYITPDYEESSARQLSRELDLTIIQITQGSGKEYMATHGYSVIPVDADTYQKKAHNIVI